jgi:hypothetical protein
VIGNPTENFQNKDSTISLDGALTLSVRGRKAQRGIFGTPAKLYRYGDAGVAKFGINFTG